MYSPNQEPPTHVERESKKEKSKYKKKCWASQSSSSNFVQKKKTGVIITFVIKFNGLESDLIGSEKLLGAQILFFCFSGKECKFGKGVFVKVSLFVAIFGFRMDGLKVIELPPQQPAKF